VRLFCAIDIGSSAQDRVAAEQARLADRLPGSSLRWVKRDHLHLTLVFLGEISEECAGPVIDAVRDPIPQSPFSLTFGGLGVFPPRGAPRALWIAVKSGAPQVVAVQAIVAARLRALGVELERRPFSPHLTVARWRDGRPSDRPRAMSADDATIATVEVSAVTLFQSRLSSAGPTYTVLARSPLIAS